MAGLTIDQVAETLENPRTCAATGGVFELLLPAALPPEASAKVIYPR